MARWVHHTVIGNTWDFQSGILGSPQRAPQVCQILSDLNYCWQPFWIWRTGRKAVTYMNYAVTPLLRLLIDWTVAGLTSLWPSVIRLPLRELFIVYVYCFKNFNKCFLLFAAFFYSNNLENEIDHPCSNTSSDWLLTSCHCDVTERLFVDNLSAAELAVARRLAVIHLTSLFDRHCKELSPAAANNLVRFASIHPLLTSVSYLSLRKVMKGILGKLQCSTITAYMFIDSC